MKDALGNAITASSLLCWHPDLDMLKRGLIVQAVQVQDGGLSLGNSDELSPAALVIQVVIPVDMGKHLGKVEPVLSEMLCVVNPSAATAVEKLMESVKRDGRPQ